MFLTHIGIIISMNQVKRNLAKSGFSCKSLDANYIDYIEHLNKGTKGFKTPEELKRIDRENRIKRSLIKQNKSSKSKKSIKQINIEAKKASYLKPRLVIKAFNYVNH